MAVNVPLADLPSSESWFTPVDLKMKNGVLGEIPQIAPRSALPDPYHWVVISGLPVPDYRRYVEHVMRATWGQITIANTAETPQADKEKQRKAAIIIGAIRAQVCSTYEVVEGDFNKAECKMAGFKYAPGQSDADYATALQNWEAQPHETRGERPEQTRGTFSANGGTATATGRAAREATFARLTEAEKAWAAGCCWLSVCIPVLQGASLVLTGHHYIKNTYNYFEGALKQCIGIKWGDLEAEVTSLGQAFRDYAFHKACHPMSPSRKRQWSRERRMKQILEETGHTAAAIRLPAVPSEVQGLKAGMAVFARGKFTLEQMGAQVTTTEGDSILKALTGPLPDGWTEAMEKQNIQRAKEWVVNNGPSIAYVAGINSASNQAAAMAAGTASVEDTTAKAFSIKKLVETHRAEYNAGANAGRALLRYMADQIEKTGQGLRTIHA